MAQSFVSPEATIYTLKVGRVKGDKDTVQNGDPDLKSSCFQLDVRHHF
jgi:hypothetical protein